MTDQVPTPPPFPTPPLLGDVPPLIDTRSRDGNSQAKQTSENQQPSSWGSLSFFLGAFTFAILALWILATLSGFKDRSMTPRVAITAAVALWGMCLPINIAGLIAGFIGVTQPQRKQFLTYCGITLNGVSVAILVAMLVISIFSKGDSRQADVRGTLQRSLNGELYDEESFKNRHPSDPHKGRITRRIN